MQKPLYVALISFPIMIVGGGLGRNWMERILTTCPSEKVFGII